MITEMENKNKVAVRSELVAPPQFKIIFLNDDVTTVDFVLTTLISFFNYDVEGAKAIALQIHDDGAATVAVLPFELAEQKAVEVTASARNNGFPLNIKLEPSS